VDAFSQALTNPLLVKSVYKASTFSRAGMREIKRTSRLQDLVDRNTRGEDIEPLVTFSRTDSTATR
jgi:prostaglandin-endoperoxide synthase 2